MIWHRLIRLVCLIGATIAPLLAALLCRLVARIAVKHILPHSGHEHLPALTQTWVADLANGNFPLTLIALLVSALVAGAGLFILFSKRFTADTMATMLAGICCIAFTVAVVLCGSTMIAIVLPFLPNDAS